MSSKLEAESNILTFRPLKQLGRTKFIQWKSVEGGKVAKLKVSKEAKLKVSKVAKLKVESVKRGKFESVKGDKIEW